MRTGLFVALGLCGLAAAASRGADWPSFRGPNGNGVIADASVPGEWAADKNVAWKAAVPGVAWSCPIVVGAKVFLTTAVSPDQPKPKGGGGGGGGRPGPTRINKPAFTVFPAF